MRKLVGARFCKGCGIEFYPKDSRQKYHSASCRNDHYDRTYYAKTTITKTCLNPKCGKEFETSKPKLQDYCSPECRVGAKTDRIASRRAEKVTYLAERFLALKQHEFKCVFCGKGPKDGITLDVDTVDGELKPVCSECKEGKKHI